MQIHLYTIPKQNRERAKRIAKEKNLSFFSRAKDGCSWIRTSRFVLTNCDCDMKK